MPKTMQICPSDGYDLGEYRYAVAKFAKLLIRARAKEQPQFLTATEYERWQLKEVQSDCFSLESLLRMAQAAWDHLWNTFIGPHGSGGVQTSDHLYDLKQNVIFFSIRDLSDTLANVENGEPVAWESVTDWTLFSSIRDGLDELPHPTRSDNDEPFRHIVTLDQAAAYVNKSKHALRKFKGR